jgi:hypothetical protein
MADNKDKIADRIKIDFGDGTRGNTVIIFIPSHDKKMKELNNQRNWASEAMDLFAKVFGGATGFDKLLGSWFDGEQKKV